MVNKKVVKVPKKSPTQVRKDLELFEKGVERLKELEAELNSMDTRGFSGDEQKIRMKLKNVSDIPAIEKDIKTLRAKIDGKYRPRRKRKSKVVGELKDLSDKIDSLKRRVGTKNNSKIEEQLAKLNERLENMKRASSKKRGFIDSNVGVIVDTDFNSFLVDVKAKLSNRIRGKEEEIEEVLRSDLQKREMNFKKRHDDLIRDFNLKKKKMTDDFEKKYEMKIKTSLKHEVAEKFNSELKKKLDSEKVELGKRYRSLLKEHAENKLKRDEDELKRKLEKRVELLKNDFSKAHSKDEKELVDKYNLKLNALENKRRLLEDRQRQFEKNRVLKEKLLEKKIRAEKIRMESKIKKEEERADKNIEEREKNTTARIAKAEAREEEKEKEASKEIEEKEKEASVRIGIRERLLNNKIEKSEKLSNDLKRKIEENSLILKEKEKELWDEMNKNILKEKNRLTENFHANLEKELAEKEKSMRAALRGEYDLMLKQKIAEHESELKKKKLDLELEIQRKMKEALS